MTAVATNKDIINISVKSSHEQASYDPQRQAMDTPVVTYSNLEGTIQTKHGDAMVQTSSPFESIKQPRIIGILQGTAAGLAADQ